MQKNKNQRQNAKSEVIEAASHMQQRLEKDLAAARLDEKHVLRKSVIALDHGDEKEFLNQLTNSGSAWYEEINFFAKMGAVKMAIEQADIEADRLIQLAGHQDLEDFMELPPVNGLTLLSVMAKIDATTIAKAKSTLQRKIAKYRRPDALQKLIVETVRKKPSITTRELLANLENQQNTAVIIEIADGMIDFDDKGKHVSAKISGLKDRLSRAKKELGISKRKKFKSR